MKDQAPQDPKETPVASNDSQQSDEMLQRIGYVTRTLHDELTGLGVDKVLEQVAAEIPDTRDRLHYVTQMTEQAAERRASG